MPPPIDPYLAWDIAQTVLQYGPKISEGAQKLWSRTRKSADPVKSPVADSESATSDTPKSSNAMEVRALAAESAIRDLQSDMVASTELIKALADQLAQFAKYIEASRLQFEAIENQNDLLCKRVEADSELLKSLEAQNAQLAKDLEVGRLRTNRLIGKCIAIGLLAIAGLAIAVRTAME